MLKSLFCGWPRPLQVGFESEQLNSLAQVTLPPSLLLGADPSTPTRINFLFFSTTGLFQVPFHLSSSHICACEYVCLLQGLQCSLCVCVIRPMSVTRQLEQDGRTLISYVVASSVARRSVSKLKDPVEIHISHLAPQVSCSLCSSFSHIGCGPKPTHQSPPIFSFQSLLSPLCVFWDFSMNGQ